MAEFFPVGIINKPEKATALPFLPVKKIDNIKVNAKEGTLSLEQYLQRLHLASFIVVHKGAIVYEKYFTMLPEDQHTLQSSPRSLPPPLYCSWPMPERLTSASPLNATSRNSAAPTGRA